MTIHKNRRPIPPEIYLAVSTLVSRYRPDLTAEAVAERLIMDLPAPTPPPAVEALAPQPTPTPARSVTPIEASQRVGVSKKTILQLIHTGQLPARKIGHRTVRILESDLCHFLAAGGNAGTITPPPAAPAPGAQLVAAP